MIESVSNLDHNGIANTQIMHQPCRSFLSWLGGDDVGNISSWGSLLSLWGILVQLHEFGQIELWLFEELGLSDHAVVLEWEDLGAFVLDLFSDFFFQAID